ncbi:MAG: thiamine phosphate synthase [Bryobacteraceae bacterium]
MILPPFYPILDTESLSRRGLDPQAAAAALLDAGAGILQFRHKGPFARAILDQAGVIAESCRRSGVLFVINDRADIALLLGSAVHAGQEDLAPADIRRVIGPARSLGFSTHNEAQFRAALEEPVDYVALGPVFPTGNKINPDAVVGVDELARLRPLSRLPLVAIGGITRANAESVLAAGADSVAVIADLFPENATLDSVRERAKEWLRVVQ